MVTPIPQGPYDPNGAIAVQGWRAWYRDLHITGVDVGVRSTGPLMGLSLHRVEVNPTLGTGIGVQITHAESEGCDFVTATVAGGLKGFVLDLPDEYFADGTLRPPRPGWQFIHCHADCDQFGLQLWNVAQVGVVNSLIYRRGTGAYNGINTWRRTQQVDLIGNRIINTGGVAGASAIVIGAGTDGVRILGGELSGFEKGVWIQAGATNVRIDNVHCRGCQTPILDETGQASIGTVTVS